MMYLDSAATTFQKPPDVAAAMLDALSTMSSPGRGGYPAAMRAADTAFACREELAGLFGVDSPERVVFTQNATHGLNLALHSLVSPGGRVVVSGYEHNAVTRPLHALGADVAVAAAPLFHPEQVLRAFEAALTPGTQAAVCSHVSNVFGFVQPVEELAALCRKRGVPLVVDASQSAGILSLDMDAWGIAYAAMPGHKSLYGPQGTGVLLCGQGQNPQPLLFGGTGSQSVEQAMPDFLPDRLEAGTHNVPGIAGLLAGVRFVRHTGLDAICRRERALTQLAAEGLRRMRGVRVYAAPDLAAQVGVLSFTADGWDTEALGSALGERGVAVRAGLHCAPLAHRTAGTLATGTVRLSFSVWNTPEEVNGFLTVLSSVFQEKSRIF